MSSHNNNSLMQQLSLTRPSPSTEQQSSQKLHPIYQALDAHNYTKALKLTSSSSYDHHNDDVTNQWDIVRALRVHALERCGKTREALVLLWEILVTNVVLSDDDAVDDEEGRKKKKKSSKECWSELYQRIVSLSDVEDVINSSHQGGASSSSVASGGGLLDVQLIDAVQRLDSTSHVPIPLPKPSSSASSTSPATTASNNNKPASTKSKSKKGSSSKSKSKKSSTSSSTQSSVVKLLPPVTDETVLQTINVTLRALGMYDTMSYMYYIAMESISASMSTKKNEQVVDLENYKCILQEGILVHFKSVCDCSNVGSVGELDIVDNDENDLLEKKETNGGQQPIHDPPLPTSMMKIYLLINLNEILWKLK